MDYEVTVHADPVGNGGVCWWAESDQLPGFTAVDDTLAKLKQRVRDEIVRVDPDHGGVRMTLAAPESADEDGLSQLITSEIPAYDQPLPSTPVPTVVQRTIRHFDTVPA